MKETLLLMLTCYLGCGGCNRQIIETLTTEDQGPVFEGEWGECEELCHPGTYVTGFRLKVGIIIYIYMYLSTT